MSKKEELKENMLSIWKILNNCKESFLFCKYLYVPETQNEKEYIENSRYFKYIRHILWRNSVIELSKLFSTSRNRDKYNISHFIKKLKPQGHFKVFKIDLNKIYDWESIFATNNLVIENLLILRDKVYAHTDVISANESLNGLTIQEMEILINLVEDIIREIYRGTFNGDPNFRTPIFGRGSFKIINNLIEHRQFKTKELYDMLNRNK